MRHTNPHVARKIHTCRAVVGSPTLPETAIARTRIAAPTAITTAAAPGRSGCSMTMPFKRPAK